MKGDQNQLDGCDIYRGIFEEDKQHGTGMFIAHNGDYFYGTFSFGYQNEGRG